MPKLLCFDCETTGTDPVRNDIIQIAGIVEVDGETKEEFNLFCQPWNYENVSTEALEVNGRTMEEIRTLPHPRDTYDRIITIFSKWVDKYNKSDKFYPAGFNVRFDIDFLAQFFVKAGDKYFGSWQNWRTIDPLPILYAGDYLGKYNLPNYKLGTVCEHLGIPIDAHDALSDIVATREVIRKVMNI